MNIMALEKQYFPFAAAVTTNQQQKPQQPSLPQSQLPQPAQQIGCILRDLLLVLSGVEGQFIRVVVISDDDNKKKSSNSGVKTVNSQQHHQYNNNNPLLKSMRLRDVVFSIQSTTTGITGDEGGSTHGSNNIAIDRSIADQVSECV